jgi:hypothetical protein
MKLSHISLIVCFVITQSVFATTNDTIVLTGKVTENRIPFPKANVKLKGTSIETITDIDGSFILKIPSNIKLSEITLIGSYVGMISKEVKVKNRKRKINIRLKPEKVIIE